MPSTPTRLLFHNAHLVTPTTVLDPGWLLTEGKSIKSLGSGHPLDFDSGSITRVIDCRGMAVLPGFIDVHVHGSVGYEVMDASPERLADMARFYARHGVTGFLATTWTAGHFETLNALRAVSVQMGQQADDEARILGVHLEGPYLNQARCGAQDVNQIRRTDRAEASDLLDSGLVRRLALAPEFPENLWLVDECVRRSVTVSAGHTDATFEQMQIAVAHGLSQVTHTFNAMSPFNHRQPGVVGAALLLPELTCELICDLVHVHPAAVRLLAQVKSPDHILLITDAVRPTGLPEGEYTIDSRSVRVQDRAVRLPDGTLAGSVLTMERALQNFISVTDTALESAWQVTSRNPAGAAGLADRKGSLEPGKDADLVMLSPGFDVLTTVVEGKVAFG
jgi:N-acetylglucosamine-6-phosphate deacetylase